MISYLSNVNDDKAVITGLYALFGLCKKFEFELEDSREPLYQIISQTFNILGDLINKLIG